jgi:hypothetical protein
MNVISIIFGVFCFFFGCWVMLIHQIYYRIVEKEERANFSFKLKAAGIVLIVIGVAFIFKGCD